MNLHSRFLITLSVSALLWGSGCAAPVGEGAEDDLADTTDRSAVSLSSALSPVTPAPPLKYPMPALDGPVDLGPMLARQPASSRPIFHTLNQPTLDTRTRRFKPVPYQFCPTDIVANPDTMMSYPCPSNGMCYGAARQIQLAPVAFWTKNYGTGLAGPSHMELVQVYDTAPAYPQWGQGSGWERHRESVASLDVGGLLGGRSSPAQQFDPQRTVTVWSFPYEHSYAAITCFVEVNGYDDPEFQEYDYSLEVDSNHQVSESNESNNVGSLGD